MHKVFCKKYGEELEGLDKPPYPGQKGEDIFDNVSKKAWEEWLEHQKMLINEGQINLADRDSRKWLNTVSYTHLTLPTSQYV